MIYIYNNNNNKQLNAIKHGCIRRVSAHAYARSIHKNIDACTYQLFYSCKMSQEASDELMIGAIAVDKRKASRLVNAPASPAINSDNDHSSITLIICTENSTLFFKYFINILKRSIQD